MSSTVIFTPSAVGFEILKALSKYRYLTTNQIIALGIANDRGHLGKVLASLLSINRRDTTGGRVERKPKEIGELDFGVNPLKGRRARMYYLTKRGAELLEFLDPELEPVHFPTRVHRFAPDYEHRVSCVDFHIAVNDWATDNDNTVPYYRQYFDWSKTSTKRKPHPATRLELSHKNADADALFLLRDVNGTERSFVFEMANGVATGRVIDKMQHLARGLADGSLNRALSFPPDKGVRILFVFENRRTAELVATRADTSPLLREYSPLFFLKALDDIGRNSLRQDWMTLDPQLPPRPLF